MNGLFKFTILDYFLWNGIILLTDIFLKMLLENIFTPKSVLLVLMLTLNAEGKSEPGSFKF